MNVLANSVVNTSRLESSGDLAVNTSRMITADLAVDTSRMITADLDWHHNRLITWPVFDFQQMSLKNK